MGLPLLPKQPLTVPMSPAIRKPKPPAEQSPSPEKIIKANPVPHFPVPKVDIKEKRTLPIPQFSLPGEEISQRKKREFEENLKKEEQALQVARLFKAQPLPTDEPSVFEIISILIFIIFRPYPMYQQLR